MNNEEKINSVVEQVRALQDTAHFYTCFMCNKNRGHRPVIIGIEGDNELRTLIVVVCEECGGADDVEKHAGMVH